MPGYLTKQETIAIAGTDDLVIQSLLDRQQFFDPAGDAESLGISSAAWPLFGLLWPSGAQLAARMAARPVQAGERILELGCGLALASLVCHRLGADVTASDCHPLAGTFLQDNLRLNGMAPMKYRQGQWGSGEALGPPQPDESPLAQAHGGPVHGVFDLIMGSDLLYERDARASLAHYIALHAGPAAQVWIVDPDRGNRAAFSKQMAAQGFGLHEERLDRAAAGEAPAYKGGCWCTSAPEGQGQPPAGRSSGRWAPSPATLLAHPLARVAPDAHPRLSSL